MSAWNIGLMKRWIAQSHYHKSRGEVHEKNYGFLTFIMQVCNADATMPERIYNSHYGNGGAGNVYLLVLSS